MTDKQIVNEPTADDDPVTPLEEISDEEISDEEIGDVENDPNEPVSKQDLSDLNEVLNFFNQVLAAHEAAINTIAAAVFGGPDEPRVSVEGPVDPTDRDSESDGEVIPVNFGNSNTSDAS